MDKAELLQRTKQFALRVLRLVDWLELIAEGGLLSAAKINPLLDEANELTAIFTAARRTSSIKPQTSNLKHPQHA